MSHQLLELCQCFASLTSIFGKFYKYSLIFLGKKASSATSSIEKTSTCNYGQQSLEMHHTHTVRCRARCGGPLLTIPLELDFTLDLISLFVWRGFFFVKEVVHDVA